MNLPVSVPFIILMAIFYTVLLSTFSTIAAEFDRPCAARAYPDQSVVCVCNDTYCDTITREIPDTNRYVAYTSNAASLRFKKSYGQLEKYMSSCSSKYCPRTTLTIDPTIKYQNITGFGGAVTDAAALNYANMTDELKQFLVESYVSKSGLEYNVIRTPVGCSDFSPYPYAYNEEPENDINLMNFDLAEMDYKYKIPMFKDLMKASSTPLYILGTVWSPPLWMKTNPSWNESSILKPEYYQTYALYHLKFLESYKKQGLPVWGITTTNQPSVGLYGTNIVSLGWTAEEMAKWIDENLGPTIRNSSYKDVQILAMDDQRPFLPYYINWMALIRPESLKYIDGVSVHFYFDEYTPPSFITLVSIFFPTKYIMATEACIGRGEPQTIIPGSWDRAVVYITDIIQNLNYQMVGWLDWNMVLNESGGPNYLQNFVDSPVIFYHDKGEFIKQPMFYAMGHFSKFFPRGSHRVNVKETKPLLTSSIENVAVITPKNTVAIVLHNKEVKERLVKIRLEDKQIVLNLTARSITTVELAYKQ